MGESSMQAVRAPMNQARETLAEADALFFDQDFLRGTISRSYYAMFYAVLALGALKGLTLSKHTHAVSFFNKEFVKNDIFSTEMSRALHYGFDERQNNDYGEIWDIESADAETALKDAKLFVKTISDYLKEN